MSIATAQRKKARRDRKRANRGGRQTVLEFVAGVQAGVVDREAGVIPGVKILGRVSKNGRTYSNQAMSDAARLYEGCSVNIDHPDRPGAERKSNDRFGRLTNVRVNGDSVYGDLEYLKTHPMAERVTEAAERMPDQYGLSHNVEAMMERVDGELIVQRIEKVRSVDLVSDPATTMGLFESVDMTTFKQLVESIPPKTIGRKYLMEILGDETLGDVVIDEPVAPEVVDAPADEQIKAAFDTAAVAVVRDESISPAETAEKVGMLMMAKEDALGGSEPTLEEEDDEDDDPAEKPASESHKPRRNPKLSELTERVESQGKQLATITEERDTLRSENNARDMLESAGREVNDVHVAALVNMPDDKSRASLVESWPKAETATSVPKPRRSRPITESNSEFEPDPEKFAQLLRS